MKFKFVSIALALLVLPALAHADRRAFIRTYEYQTMPKGGLDLELWNTQARPRWDTAETGQEWKLETEYGISDHWDLAIYQIFAQDPGGPFAYAATSVESRYRFAERGEWPVDVLAYLEINKPLAEDAVEIESKLILAKDFGSVTVAANLIAEVVLASDNAFVPGWALGVTWEVVPSFKISAETYGERNEAEEVVSWIGPAISWSPSPKWWVAAGAAFGLTESSDDFRASFIIGISL